MSDSPQDEIIIQGISASPGTVIGKAYLHKKVMPIIDATRIREEMIPDHIKRFQTAKQALCEQWTTLKEKEIQKESRDILSAQIEIIADPELSEQIERLIKNERKNAQQAIKKAFSAYIALFSKSGSDRIENRMIDLTDIRDRLIEATGSKKPSLSVKEGEVLVADEISPREVIHLSHQNLKGFVTEKGGHASHVAIIARSMGIPAVVGTNGVTGYIKEDTVVYVNGESGLVTINPSSETREQAKVLSGSQLQSQKEKQEICSRPSVTADGYPFSIRANLEFPEELHHVDQFHAEGIGLLRTESAYMDQQGFDGVEKQITFYKQFVENTVGQPVTIRLFDVGGDKFREPGIVENNPFLGWRGIRMLLDERSVLQNQLKAILTVANRHPGQVQILVPMVSTMDEIKVVKKEIDTCRRQMAEEGQSVDEDLPLGMMIEIPSAAIQVSHFSKEVDFFSIGTNDLTQYLLAVDRGNALISGLYDQRHPAMWKVINQVLRDAREHNREVEVCGELASYPVAAAGLIGMGVSTLSMSPISIPQVKEMLRKHSYSEMKGLAEQILNCDELRDIKTLFENWKKDTSDE